MDQKPDIYGFQNSAIPSIIIIKALQRASPECHKWYLNAIKVHTQQTVCQCLLRSFYYRGITHQFSASCECQSLFILDLTLLLECGYAKVSLETGTYERQEAPYSEELLISIRVLPEPLLRLNAKLPPFHVDMYKTSFYSFESDRFLYLVI